MGILSGRRGNLSGNRISVSFNASLDDCRMRNSFVLSAEMEKELPERKSRTAEIVRCTDIYGAASVCVYEAGKAVSGNRGGA